jgi:hypothetical protein
MICTLPAAIEGACKVSVEYAYLFNIFQYNLRFLGIAIDEFQTPIYTGASKAHRGATFLLPKNWIYGCDIGDEALFKQRPTQWVYVPAHHSIQRLSITLTDKYLQPLTVHPDATPEQIENQYDFSLLLKIEHCNEKGGGEGCSC